MSIHTDQVKGQPVSAETETVIEKPAETSADINGSATQSTDNVGGSSVEIDIDELVAEFEAEVMEEAKKAAATGALQGNAWTICSSAEELHKRRMSLMNSSWTARA